VQPVEYSVPAARPDMLETLSPSEVQVHGWLGARIDANITGRLDVVDTEPLLAGFEKKPGPHPWIGEHVGKWLHAATLAWAYSGDPGLREKLDSVASRLIAAQEPDGYLGTYLPAQRFGLYPGADWDVWSHKYCMIGLMTYYRYTGNKAALRSAARAADLLLRTFPAKKSILAAGTHEGMAATSVLEPMVKLYRLTGDSRYLGFCRYIVGAYDEPGGPAIVRTLLEKGDVSHTANGKAYEMLSNMVGLCELERVTGDPRILRAVNNAWSDIVTNRLYVTGTSSNHELFGSKHELPNGEDAHLGETCVTVTWIQLNIQLLRLTGEAKYADEIERSLYNHLTAAQNPRGDDWCYYTALEGHKHYDKGITCCHSSGPRGLALAPTVAYLQSGPVLYVDTFETSNAKFSVGSVDVQLDQEGDFPRKGHSTITVHTAGPAMFALKVRVPAWAAPLHIEGAVTTAGWATLPSRRWSDGDRVEVSYNLSGRVIAGDYMNYSRAALAWGPFILAAESELNPTVDSLGGVRLSHSASPTLVSDAPALRFASTGVSIWDSSKWQINLVPFADAGANGGEYRVWLRAPD
jgi:hypothetical protein